MSADIIQNGMADPENTADVMDIDLADATGNDEAFILRDEQGDRVARAIAPKSLQTGLVYDVRMRFHVEPIPRDQDMHPEDPRRIYEVYNEILQAGLVDDSEDTPSAESHVLRRIPARYATQAEILTVHTQNSYDFVMDLENWDEDRLASVGESMDSVYLSVNTPKCALLAAGGAIEAARAVMNRQVKNAIAVIRPPGHHAEHDTPMGFCFFNNVPVAVRACQKEFGDRARKVLILDWDVHHGNGVQHMFYNDPNVLYISLHVSLGGAFYPSGDDKDHLHCGVEPAMGKNVNIPWKTAGMGDGDYLYAFQQIVMPIAQDFDPDMVFICAGFDAAEGDMIGSCHVSPAGYAHMTHMLMSLADGNVVACMEGGYNLRSIAISALAVTRTLMGVQPGRLQSTRPTPAGVDSVQMVRQAQCRYWPCLFPADISEALSLHRADRFHDIIRDWQAQQLWESQKMIPLFIARDELSRSFDKQVLASSNYNTERPLLLIFHDPPDMLGTPDPRTQVLSSHNTWLIDPLKEYIAWATRQGFAVMDVNVPLHHTESNEDETYSNADPRPREERVSTSLLLAKYIWENYIELNEPTHLFIIGVGAAYASIIEMLKTNERFADHVTHVFFFINEHTLLSCRSATNDDLASWYYDHSTIFIPQDHQIWTMTKQRKRFGKHVMSMQNSISSMLEENMQTCFATMTTDIEGEWEVPAKAAKVDTTTTGVNGEPLPGKGTNGASMDMIKDSAMVTAGRLPPVGNFSITPHTARNTDQR